MLSLILLCGLGARFDAPMEVIRLHSGVVVRGEVLKEKADVLVVDLGIEVISIPKREIAGRSKGDVKGALAGSPGGREFGESGALFATKDLPLGLTVRDLVKQWGEGVVMVKTPSGSGSGFVIDDAGHCITNYHVIEGETRITVDLFVQAGDSFSEKAITDVEIVATSPFYDLALLRMPAQETRKFKRVFLGYYDDVRQGERAFAIGSPLGLTRSVTEGIISNRNRNVAGQLYIQTTAQINPGNSGGPLFNMRGQVIGVTNMRIVRGEGLGFAIPSDYVMHFLKNREAYAYNKDNPNEGFRYTPPPRRQRREEPPMLRPASPTKEPKKADADPPARG